MGKRLGMRKDTLRRMEACGVLTPPPNLAQMQAAAQRLLGGGECAKRFGSHLDAPFAQGKKPTP